MNIEPKVKKPRGTGKRWVKGQSGNPAGPKPLTTEEKLLRVLNRMELERLINKYLSMEVYQLNSYFNDDKITGLEGMLVSIIVMARETGDYKRMDSLLDRLLGKSVERIAAVHMQASDVSSVSDADLITQAQVAIEYLAQKGKALTDDSNRTIVIDRSYSAAPDDTE